MKHPFFFLGFFISSLFYLTACSEKKTSIVDSEEISVPIFNLEKAFAAAKSPTQIDSILLANPDVLELYFKTKKSQSAALATSLFQLYQNPDFLKFYKQSTEKQFFGNHTWEIQLKEAIAQLKQLYPNLKIPKIKTVFTGFGVAGQYPTQHVVVTDSLIIVGLDYFMGIKGLFLPPDVYDYQVRRLEPNGLAGQILLLYANYFNQHVGANRSLLSDMIWYGKSYYFAKKLVPELPDSTLFGYTSPELAGANAYQDLIWEHFVSNSLLYKKDEFLKTKYVGERPKTPEIGPACPGSIGRWLGYTIVQHYQEKFPDKNLSDIMKNGDADKMLRDSEYRGKGNSKE